MIKELGLISKLITSETEQQTITVHILPNISRTKGKQAMKFVQLIEYNMINILKNHAKIVVGKLVSDAFMKNQIWDISGSKI